MLNRTGTSTSTVAAEDGRTPRGRHVAFHAVRGCLAQQRCVMRIRSTGSLLSILFLLLATSARVAAAAPPAPTPLSPADGASVLVPFTIAWSAVSDPTGIVAYNW